MYNCYIIPEKRFYNHRAVETRAKQKVIDRINKPGPHHNYDQARVFRSSLTTIRRYNSQPQFATTIFKHDLQLQFATAIFNHDFQPRFSTTGPDSAAPAPRFCLRSSILKSRRLGSNPSVSAGFSAMITDEQRHRASEDGKDTGLVEGHVVSL